MLDFDDDDDDLGDYEIDYGVDTKPAAAKAPSSAPSSFRGKFNTSSLSSHTPPPPKSSTPTPAPRATGGVFGFLNNTSAVTTAKKDVFDFSTARAPSAPPSTSVSYSSPHKIPPKPNSALAKAERFLSSNSKTSNVKTFTSSTSNAGFTMSDDEDDDLDDIDEIDNEDIAPSKPSFSISAKSSIAATKPSSSNFTMSSDDEDLEIGAHSDSEDEKIYTKPASSSVLKSFNLKTVDDLLGGNILLFL